MTGLLNLSTRMLDHFYLRSLRTGKQIWATSHFSAHAPENTTYIVIKVPADIREGDICETSIPISDWNGHEYNFVKVLSRVGYHHLLMEQGYGDSEDFDERLCTHYGAVNVTTVDNLTVIEAAHEGKVSQTKAKQKERHPKLKKRRNA